MYCPSGEITACLFFPVSVSFSTLSVLKVGFAPIFGNLCWSLFAAAKYQAEIEAIVRIEAARATVIGWDLSRFNGANAVLTPFGLGSICAMSEFAFD